MCHEMVDPVERFVNARALAADTSTISAPDSPGPLVTAIASI